MHEELVPVGTVTDEHGTLITVLSYVEHNYAEVVSLESETFDADGKAPEPVCFPVDQIHRLSQLLSQAAILRTPPQITA